MEKFVCSLPITFEELDKYFTDSKNKGKKAICDSITEMIKNLNNNDFASINDDDMVYLGNNTEIHKDDYINALVDFKYKLILQGNWVE